MAKISKKPRPWVMTFFLSVFLSFSSSQFLYWANTRFNILKTSIVGSAISSKKILLNKTLNINPIILALTNNLKHHHQPIPPTHKPHNPTVITAAYDVPTAAFTACSTSLNATFLEIPFEIAVLTDDTKSRPKTERAQSI